MTSDKIGRYGYLLGRATAAELRRERERDERDGHRRLERVPRDRERPDVPAHAAACARGGVRASSPAPLQGVLKDACVRCSANITAQRGGLHRGPELAHQSPSAGV